MIFDLTEMAFYIKPGPTDMRKAINGLAVIVQEEMKKDPFSTALFLFCNRTGKILKALYWDKTGFCLWQKRLEKQKFPWPDNEQKARAITYDQLKLLLHRKYGRTSEQVEPDQQELFDDDTQEPEALEEETTTIQAHSRKKPGRKPLSDMLPREEVVHDIPEEKKTCACGCELKRIGEEISERLQIVPEKIFVLRHIRPKYACRNCEGSADEDNPAVRIAPAVPSIIPGSIVTPGLLAFILVNKFCDHLPFYRQEKRFERIGIHISRQNMSNWLLKAYRQLKPLLKLLQQEIRGGPVLRMDETPVQVLGEKDRPNNSQSYMWLALGGDINHRVALFQYRQTRAAYHISEILGDYTGYLQTDGYEGYNSALKNRDDIVHVGCCAHARRKFFEASKAAKKKGSPEEAMGQSGKIYQVEKELRDENLEPEVFLEKRRQKVTPLLEKFHKWLTKKSLHTPPSILLGKAEWSKSF